MPLFRLNGPKATRLLLDEKRRKEEFVHKLIEANLEVFFEGLILIATKPRIGGKEFDTLAYDPVSKTPVIIEYKREKDKRVVEQVSLYFVKLRNNKSQVMLLFNRNESIEDLESINFENPQIIVIAKEFTPEHRELLGLMSAYLRLWQYKLYAENLFVLEEVRPIGDSVADGAKQHPSPSTPAGGWNVEHFKMSPAARKIYDDFEKEVVGMDSRVKQPKINKHFIGFGATGWYFCAVSPKGKFLRVEVKLRGRAPRIKSLHIERLRNRVMTHRFRVWSHAAIKPALQIIRQAFEDSL
jgi:predicted transport protein